MLEVECFAAGSLVRPFWRAADFTGTEMVHAKAVCLADPLRLLEPEEKAYILESINIVNYLIGCVTK